MADDSQGEKPAQVVSMSVRDLLSVIVLGGLVGILVWGLGFVLNRYVFDAYLCQSATSNQCAYAKNYAAIVSNIIIALAALAALVRLRVYRPLLVLIAAILSVWGIVQLGWGLAWYQGAAIAVVMYALAFGVYSWIARLRDFWITLIVVIVLVVAVRLAFAL